MSSSMASSCKKCKAKPPLHTCLLCGKTHESIEEIIAHQKQRSHFGGHYVVEHRSRNRRVPWRVNFDQGIEPENLSDEESAGEDAPMDVDDDILLTI